MQPELITLCCPLMARQTLHLLMGAPSFVVQPVQKVQNSAAPRHPLSTSLLQKLQWIPITECIEYKGACLHAFLSFTYCNSKSNDTNTGCMAFPPLSLLVLAFGTPSLLMLNSFVCQDKSKKKKKILFSHHFYKNWNQYPDSSLLFWSVCVSAYFSLSLSSSPLACFWCVADVNSN